MAIVEKCEGEIVYTIEGNTRDMCAEKMYTVGQALVFGYGVTKY